MTTPELPAHYGGAPVRARYLPYGRQSISDEDIAAVTAVLRSDWLTTGPNVAEFEAAVAARVRARHAVAFSSGTAALHGAVFAAGLGPGDEAITTPLTFAATANCLLYQNAAPVFADVEEGTLTLDPRAVERCITPRTRALLPVDYAGHPADLQALAELALKHKLIVIEDAAHALGATLDGRPVGGISAMTMFSFHPVKHITTGEGGVIATDDAALADRLKLFRSHGIASDPRARQAAGSWYYEMVALGYNYRLTDIGCVLGLSQLRRLDDNLARRRAIAARYTAAFADLDGLTTLQVRPGVEPAWHLFPVRIDAVRFGANRAEVFAALRAENLGVNVHYIPVHLHPYYRERFGYRGGEFPRAEAAYAGLISLPMFHGMTDQDVQDIVRAVTRLARYYRERGRPGVE